MRRRLGWTLALAAACAACDDPASHPTVAIEAVSLVRGTLFQDLNGDLQPSAGDQFVKGWRVRLLGSNRAVLDSAVTDSLGAFRFEKVPTGRVQLEVDRSPLSDTLEVFGLSLGQDLTLGLRDTVSVTVGFTYPKVSIEAVATLPPGRRVFVEGIALNPVQATGPRELHIRSGAKALRATNVVRRAISPGDSVRMLGRRATEGGRPVLTGADLILIRPSVGDPEPVALTTAVAATAQQGALDADLVRIRNADLTAARNDLNDVILTVDDGTGAVEIVVRSFLGADASFFNPDSVRVREATGLLLPFVNDSAQTRWRLATRAATDLRIEPERRRAPNAGPVP